MGLFESVRSLFEARQEQPPAAKPGRNEPCWCGSGRKYKKCHEPEDRSAAAGKACALNCGPT